jgi:hypothetical protein
MEKDRPNQGEIDRAARDYDKLAQAIDTGQRTGRRRAAPTYCSHNRGDADYHSCHDLQQNDQTTRNPVELKRHCDDDGAKTRYGGLQPSTSRADAKPCDCSCLHQ